MKDYLQPDVVSEAMKNGRVFVNLAIYDLGLRNADRRGEHPVLKEALENPFGVSLEAQLDIIASKYLFKASHEAAQLKTEKSNYKIGKVKQLVNDAQFLNESRLEILSDTADKGFDTSYGIIDRFIKEAKPKLIEERIDYYRREQVLHAVPDAIRRQLFERAQHPLPRGNQDNLANSLALLDRLHRSLGYPETLDLITTSFLAQANRLIPLPSAVKTSQLISARYAIYRAREESMRTS